MNFHLIAISFVLVLKAIQSCTPNNPVNCSVEYNGWIYATLAFVNPSETTIGCENSYLPLPEGWQIANTSEIPLADIQTVAEAHPWGAHILVFNYPLTTGTLDSTYVDTSTSSISGDHGWFVQYQAPNLYRANSCHLRVLIAKLALTSNPTLATINPTKNPTLGTSNPTSNTIIPTNNPTPLTYIPTNNPTNDGCVFVMWNSQQPNDPIVAQYTMMLLPDFTALRAQFIEFYNLNQGIPCIKGWTSSNCCFNVQGDNYLTVNGIAVYPGHGNTQYCNPSGGYVTNRYYYFHQIGTSLSSSITLSSSQQCSINNNPGIFYRCGPTIAPTKIPTMEPTLATINPTKSPSMEPTSNPTENPTTDTIIPSQNPTINPILVPTTIPSNDPTISTINPTNNPTIGTINPTIKPTNNPTPLTYVPTLQPTIDGCVFVMWNSQQPNDPIVTNNGYTMMLLADFTALRSQFIEFYNLNQGILCIKGWSSSNCCFNVQGDNYLTVNSIAVYPGHGNTQYCNPSGGYITNRYYYFHQIGTSLSSSITFSSSSTCSINNNPGIFYRCGPTKAPTKIPTMPPTLVTTNPTKVPSNNPTVLTINPTNNPTIDTMDPTIKPTNNPTSNTISPTSFPTPPPVEIPNVVYNGWMYATLSGVNPSQTSIGCESSYLPIPAGWEIATTSKVSIEDIQKVAEDYPWGTHVLVFNYPLTTGTLGTTYVDTSTYTATASRGWHVDFQAPDGYKASACSLRVLIIRPAGPTFQPTSRPTLNPTISTKEPTVRPTNDPTKATNTPTKRPTPDGCQFVMWNSQKPQDPIVTDSGYQMMLLPDFNDPILSEQFTEFYNYNQGIPCIQGWTSSNCCFNLEGDNYLTVNGIAVYPGHSNTQYCNPAGGYITDRYYYFHQIGTSLTSPTFSSSSQCSINNNPAIFYRCGKLRGECEDIESLDCSALANTDWGCNNPTGYTSCPKSCGYCKRLKYCTDANNNYTMSVNTGSSSGGTRVYIESPCFLNTFKQSAFCNFGGNLVKGIPVNGNRYFCIAPQRRSSVANPIEFRIKFGRKYFGQIEQFTYNDNYGCSTSLAVTSFNIKFQKLLSMTSKPDDVYKIKWDPNLFPGKPYVDISYMIWSNQLQLYGSNHFAKNVENNGETTVKIPKLGSINNYYYYYRWRYRYYEMLQIKFIVKGSDGNNNRRRLINLEEGFNSLFDVGPIDLYTAKQQADIASNQAAKYYRDGSLDGIHNGKADAFRHCYWNCLMAKKIGIQQSKAIADNHEEFGNNPCEETTMDLFNNQKGREFFQQGKDCKSACLAAARNNVLQTSLKSTEQSSECTSSTTTTTTTSPTTTEPEITDPCTTSPLCIDYYGGKCPLPDLSGGAGATGDPHYRTFDGLRYSFQGNGVFDLVNVNDYNFNIQVFSEPLRPRLGVTWVTGIAFKQQNYPSFAFLNDIRQGKVFKFWYNGTLINNPNAMTFDYFSINVQYRRVEIKFDIGIRLVLTSYYSLTVEASCALNGKTLGLLGVFDNDKTNDLTSKNNTIIPISSSSSYIYYNFGETWIVDSNNILFPSLPQNQRRRSLLSDFVPQFDFDLNSVDPGFLTSAQSICDNFQDCLFDVIITGNLSTANDTLQGEKEIGTLVTSINDRQPLTVVCLPICENNGTCISDGVCQCQFPYTGERCNELSSNYTTLSPTREPTSDTAEPTPPPTIQTMSPTAPTKQISDSDESSQIRLNIKKNILFNAIFLFILFAYVLP